MSESTGFLPGLSPVCGRSVLATFDGGMLSSDSGVAVLAELDRKLGISRRLAACLRDERAQERVVHPYADMILFRMLLIAAGYPDGDDGDALRHDPAFRTALGRLPDSGVPLCSQPTLSRLENLPDTRALLRMMGTMIDLFCDSYDQPPDRIVLDIDDTESRVHGGQQLSLFHAKHDGYCLLPIHIYEADSGKPVAVILRPGRTPTGAEVVRVLRRVIRRIRRRWPKVTIQVRGDSHYGRTEVLQWCETQDIAYVFGLAGNAVLARLVQGDIVRTERDREDFPDLEKVRRHADLRYRAGRWPASRRVIARIEVSSLGTDVRYIVTNLPGHEHVLYETVYCARGRMENMIKEHKRHLASDRTSCSKATANQFRLILHTGAYWLMHTLRTLVPQESPLRHAQFDTLRLCLIKIAGRFTEKATRIRIALASDCPFRSAIYAVCARIAALPP